MLGTLAPLLLSVPKALDKSEQEAVQSQDCEVLEEGKVDTETV